MTDFTKLDDLFARMFYIASELSESEKEEIKEFVDHGEYGLALSTTIAIYREENKRPSEMVYDLVRQIATEMGADEKEYSKLK
jgi:hypothetical protein